MSKILVTGANGYLGKGVVCKLLDAGHEVIATDFADSHIDKRAKFIAGDIFSIENPYEYFEEPDYVLHMAWRNGFVHNADSHIEDLPNHYAFIKRFAESKVKKISVLGSMHEVGFFEGSIDEKTSTHPQSLYGVSKDTLRNLTKLECEKHNIIFQWLRGFYIVGNTIDGSSIFSKIVQAANEGKQKFPFTTGVNQYDFLDYDDFCDYVVAAVAQDEVNGIINICSGKPESLASRVERFIKENNFDITLEYGAFPDRPYDSKAIWGNNEKIQQILGK
jgi:dTDP-6-deoxy-L-talose 4-dehydrogenase (NAD+)